MCDHTRHAMFKSSSSPIRLNCFFGLLVLPDLSPIENVWSRDTPPAATPDQLWQYVEAEWITVSQGYIQSLFGSMPKRVVAVIVNNDGYTKY
ncbi:hypothetical protein TNCV_2189451 [Trichonephila clavipes]|nr:hypothetical protein TNCV_2189451 [Trichonephila clavipes]